MVGSSEGENGKGIEWGQCGRSAEGGGGGGGGRVRAERVWGTHWRPLKERCRQAKR